MGMVREPGSGVPFPYHLNSREITSGKQIVGKQTVGTYCKLSSLTAAPEFPPKHHQYFLVTSLTVFIGLGIGCVPFRLLMVDVLSKVNTPKKLRKERQTLGETTTIETMVGPISMIKTLR